MHAPRDARTVQARRSTRAGCFAPQAPEGGGGPASEVSSPPAEQRDDGAPAGAGAAGTLLALSPLGLLVVAEGPSLVVLPPPSLPY